MTATNKGLQRFYEYRDRIAGLIKTMQESPEPNPLLIRFFTLINEQDKRVIDCLENHKPLIMSHYGNAGEIFAAMDIECYGPEDNLFVHQQFTKDMEESDNSPFPQDMCALTKLVAWGCLTNIIPTPTMIVAMLQPCDALSAVQEAVQNMEGWKDIPTFAPDPTYGRDKSDYVYFAGELKRMIAFLEHHTGRKMDYGKLRDVVEETNRQYEAWAEYNELRRAVPCPHNSFIGGKLGWIMTQHMKAGQAEVTEIMKMLAFDAEQKVKAKQGPLPKEKIRVMWADMIPTWADPIAAWLEQERGANVVMDFQSATPYERIDTSTEESMLLGLARRTMSEIPMIRAARGKVDYMIEDLTRLVKDYKCDCVIFPGHTGHKDQSASIGFMKEACRELNVPLLSLAADNFDPRTAPLDVMKRQIGEFFDAHELGK